MLFNSFSFLLAFLPVVFIGFFILGRQRLHGLARLWLVASSLFFYAWGIFAYLPLIISSLTLNFAIGTTINRSSLRKSYGLLIFGLGINFTILLYYKYFGFLSRTVNSIGSLSIPVPEIILPLGISFFTFQQVGYLVDCYRGETRTYRFLDYCAFIVFFPQWIAGPIIQHKEIIPQFDNPGIYRPQLANVSVGLTTLILGLFKKVVLADGIRRFASPGFDLVNLGTRVVFFESWIVALAYSFQLYFDFSGYCDMAVGLGNLFNIKLPINFNSPYKATSIIDFWKRWHMTLSRFLKEYLYIPLGGNRCGKLRRHINLFITMLLGGIWHGAGWTFVVWGGFHGLCLSVNHIWRGSRVSKMVARRIAPTKLISHAATFLSVVIGWVIFRSPSLRGAYGLTKGMFGFNGFSFPIELKQCLIHSGMGPRLSFSAYCVQFWPALLWIAGLSWIVFAFPNTREIMGYFSPELSNKGVSRLEPTPFLHWRPTMFWSLGVSVLAIISLMSLTNPTEFLYFQF